MTPAEDAGKWAFQASEGMNAHGILVEHIREPIFLNNRVRIDSEREAAHNAASFFCNRLRGNTLIFGGPGIKSEEIMWACQRFAASCQPRTASFLFSIEWGRHARSQKDTAFP